MAWIEKRSSKYLLRWREPDGTEHSKAFRTKDEARTAKAGIESELLNGTYIPRAARERPLGDYVAEVLNSESLQPSTMYQYRSAFNVWVNPLIGDAPIGDIDTAQLRRFFAEMRKMGASDDRVRRTRTFLSRFFRRAVQEGIIARNPAEAIRVPRAPRREIRVLTPEEVQAVSEASPERWQLVPLLSAWGTLRIGEIGALNEDSFTPPDAILVRRSVATAGSRTYIKEPKSAASRRTIRLPDWVADELTWRIMRFRDPEGWIFKTTRGSLLSHVTYHPIWQKALRDAGFPKPWPRPHDLRHTAVALMIRSGADPKQIQARCGHATITETFDTYGHLFPGHDDKLIAALEAYRPESGKVLPFRKPQEGGA